MQAALTAWAVYCREKWAAAYRTVTTEMQKEMTTSTTAQHNLQHKDRRRAACPKGDHSERQCTAAQTGQEPGPAPHPSTMPLLCSSGFLALCCQDCNKIANPKPTHAHTHTSWSNVTELGCKHPSRPVLISLMALGCAWYIHPSIWLDACMLIPIAQYKYTLASPASMKPCCANAHFSITSDILTASIWDNFPY